MKEFKVLSQMDGSWLTLKHGYHEYSMCAEAQKFLRPYAGKTIEVSSSPLVGAVKLYRAKRQPEAENGFIHWTTGRKRVVLCDSITNRLFPGARALWVREAKRG